MQAHVLAGRLRALREAAGLTQAEVAARAGMSRQMVGAVESGQHLPRVDAGAALARALGTTVEALLAPAASDVVAVAGGVPPDGPVRLGRVGERLVCAPAPASGESWTPADGIARNGAVEVLPDARPGVVVVGCDPAIGLAARLVGEGRGPRLLAVAASTRSGLAALAGARAHATVVHAPDGGLPDPPLPVWRWHLARWRVGLAGSPDLPGAWWRAAIAGRRPVAQREPGAGSQAAFARAVAAAGGTLPGGPLTGGHLEAAGLARSQGLVAVTIEPAALAAGLAFHALETHTTELWVTAGPASETAVALLGTVLTSAAFKRQLAAVGGYDLDGCGAAVAG